MNELINELTFGRPIVRLFFPLQMDHVSHSNESHFKHCHLEQVEASDQSEPILFELSESLFESGIRAWQ